VVAKDPTIEIHVVGHSAGSILQAPLIDLLTTVGKIPSGPLAGEVGMGLPLASVTLWAPACTIELFKAHYLRAIETKRIGAFSLFTLTDKAEQDDHCAHVYHKSLLYLVSNAFEEKPRVPWISPDGTPILGMEKFIRSDPKVTGLIDLGSVHWVRSPNDEPIGSVNASRSTAHGAFDDDTATLQSTLALNPREDRSAFGVSVSARGVVASRSADADGVRRAGAHFGPRRRGIRLRSSSWLRGL